MRLTYSYKQGEFAEAIAEISKPIAKAATAAMRDTADLAKQRGRASIAGAGFSARWQNALRAQVYPKNRDSIGPAALVWHKIPYAGVFENGAVIQGKPRLWLPIEANLPVGARGKRVTPKTFPGQLRLVLRAGGNPLLVADIGKGRGRKRALPMFVGVQAVKIGKKFAITEAVREAARALPSFYEQHIKG